MTLEGTVVNGRVVQDLRLRLSEGTRVRFELPEEDVELLPDPALPPDHPLAPYHREREVAILRASIEAMKAGERGLPLDDAMSQLARELNLPVTAPK